MAERPPEKRQKLDKVQIDDGEVLHLNHYKHPDQTWPGLEEYLRHWRECKYASAEVHFPDVFTSNSNQQFRHPFMGSSVVVQYLQHSTHSPEEGRIWDDPWEFANLKGNTKPAGLYIPTNSSDVLVTTWKRSLERKQLQQLHIDECGCGEIGQQCSECCTSLPTWASAVENHYSLLARLTCKPTSKTCNGEECKKVEKVLPGSYVWFGIPDSKEDGPQLIVGKQQATKEEFKRYWKLESRYGVRSFVVDMHMLLQAYQESIRNGQASDVVRHCHGSVSHQVVLRCGGTIFYRQEVCYVVIVTYEGDGFHDNFLAVNNPRIDDAKSPRLDWSSLLDENGCYIQKEEAEYPTFTPHHKKGDGHRYWDHVVFAFHLPDGKELSIAKDSLVGGGPLQTVHNTPDTKCHKFRRFGENAAVKCEEDEKLYAEAQ